MRRANCAADDWLPSGNECNTNFRDVGHASVTDEDDEGDVQGSGLEHRSKYQDDDDSKSNNSAAQDVVAASTALMGENILDSPTQTGSARLYRLRDRSALGTPQSSNDHSLSFSCMPSLDSDPPMTADNSDALSVGIMAQGLAWARRQRDQRQRLYLQHQAEQQLRKIRHAQAQEKAASQGRSLLDNSTFQNLMHNAAKKSEDEEAEDVAEKEAYSSDDDEAFFVSKSGDGYSVELPVDLSIDEEDASWIPPVRVDDETDMDASPFILTPEERQQIAVSVLPRGIAYCRWKRLYSLARDGDSFDACLRSIAHERQTLMVVRTSRDAVFGGFADEPWEGNAHGSSSYFGSPGACLFRVDPVANSTISIGKMQDSNANNGDDESAKVASSARPKTKVKCYRWTGANRYIQLCDAKHKMLAFGGGGDGGSFGLCVGQDFLLGSTGSCATFDNDPLCDQENFEIVDMEIYGFLVGQF